jgi:2-polyprenyl-6-methoxyphenol hydroxylase-like FAD-dependent oxidoreductase
MDSETFVLIAGGGPVGLSAAIDLMWRGVPCMLVNDRFETATHPKCNTTNARSMEHFRRLGVAPKLRTDALPADVQRASAYVTRFCGHEFGRLPRAYTDWPTPETPATISQVLLERALRKHAEEQDGARVHYGWRLQSFTTDQDGVVAELIAVATGATHRVRARYLIGADGGSSSVRRALGFRMIGDDGREHRAFMGGTMLSYFIRVPGLIAASGRAATHMTWIINPEMRAMMYSQDGRETWVVHYQVPKDTDPDTLDMQAVFRRMLGVDMDVEIISGGPWTGGLALVAEHYQSGPVFLAGDAAHLFTPLGGLGMNTGLGDVFNLTWKLAAAHQGWAGPKLLQSYEPERHPIGARNAQLGVHCTRVMDGWELPPGFEDDGDAAQKTREDFGRRIIEEDRVQYRTVGLQLGERYASSVIWPDDTPSPPDRWDTYVPSQHAGARAPHVWLSEKHSVHDEIGRGLALLDFGNPEGAATFAAVAAAKAIPLNVVPMNAAPEPYASKLVLVRPDHHIAWHGDVAERAAEILERVRGA